MKRTYLEIQRDLEWVKKLKEIADTMGKEEVSRLLQLEIDSLYDELASLYPNTELTLLFPDLLQYDN